MPGCPDIDCTKPSTSSTWMSLQRFASLRTPIAGSLRCEARKHPLMAPTLVLVAKEDSRLMREEIFGPILPILPYKHLDEAIAYVNAHDRPLALYHFDHDAARTQRVLDRCVAGGIYPNNSSTS